jgi:hypothetical protein
MYDTYDSATINAIEADANANGAAFIPGPGQVTAFYFDLPIPPQVIVRKPFIIEVLCGPPLCAGQIGDFVWHDGKQNGVTCNGVQDPTDLGSGGIPNVTGSLTIHDNGGMNVISISSLNYNSETLTLSGGASDSFIINVAGGWTFADSRITLNGVAANQVVFNSPTAGAVIGYV